MDKDLVDWSQVRFKRTAYVLFWLLPWERIITPVITFGFRAPWSIRLVHWHSRWAAGYLNALYSEPPA